MIEVLYEDNHLLAVNKPSGLLTQPSGTEQDSLEAQAKRWLKEKYQKPGNVFLEAVHRIDKPVSGIVLFAKTSKALSRLNESLREKRSEKVYQALVEGIPTPSEATLEHYLTHDDFQASLSTAKDPKAKLARLHYRIIEKRENGTLVEIALETGRYHQIRAQMAAIGCPIVGDTRYGAKKIPGDKICLHHCRLSIPHPTTGEMITILAPQS